MLPSPNNSPQHRRKQTRVTTKESSEEHEKKDPNDYPYDVKQKGWRGPVVGRQDTLHVTRVLRKNHAEMMKQSKEGLLHNRKKAQKYQTPDLDESDDAASVILDLTETPGADIPKPFSLALKEARGATWNAPTWAEGQASPREFMFEKPVVKVDSGIHGTVAQLTRAEQQIAEKEKEVAILRQQLHKSQQENYRLVQALQACSGKQFDQMEKENRQLKANVERLVRDNTKLQGQIRQQGNTVIHKMNYEQYIADRANIRTRSRSKSPSTSSRSSFKLDARILPHMSPQTSRTSRKSGNSGQTSGHNSKRSSISVML